MTASENSNPNESSIPAGSTIVDSESSSAAIKNAMTLYNVFEKAGCNPPLDKFAQLLGNVMFKKDEELKEALRPFSNFFEQLCLDQYKQKALNNALEESKYISQISANGLPSNVIAAVQKFVETNTQKLQSIIKHKVVEAILNMELEALIQHEITSTPLYIKDNTPKPAGKESSSEASNSNSKAESSENSEQSESTAKVAESSETSSSPTRDEASVAESSNTGVFDATGTLITDSTAQVSGESAAPVPDEAHLG